MLEADVVLRTYRLDVPPEELGKRICTATRIHDHPTRFLTYEGSVNNGLGSVRIVDSGTYRLLDDGEECCRLAFDGRVLAGEFRLTRIEDNEWEFVRRRDNADAQYRTPVR